MDCPTYRVRRDTRELRVYNAGRCFLFNSLGPPIVYNSTATQGDLLIESVAEEHEGHYRCMLNGINPKCSRSAQLVLLCKYCLSAQGWTAEFLPVFFLALFVV